MPHRENYDFRLWTPWTERARAALAAASESAWANPMHPGSEGRRAAVWLEALEATVAQLTGAPHVGFFADREAAVTHLLASPRRTATSSTNRRTVLTRIQGIAVDASGQAAWPECDAVLLQYGNEETGVIDEYSGGAIRIVDASNALGRAAITGPWDYLIGSARAWGAPVDVAVVLSARALDPHPIPALPLAAVAVHELEQAWLDLESRESRTAAAMQRFESTLLARLPEAQFHGTQRVPHIRSLSLPHLDAETLVRALDVAGYTVGAGSACSRDGAPSHVLAAMGLETLGNVRFALPIDADLDHFPDFADVLADTVADVRRDAAVTTR